MNYQIYISVVLVEALKDKTAELEQKIKESNNNNNDK